MTNKKKMTRREALTIAMEVISQRDPQLFEDEVLDETFDVLEKMLNSINKQAARPKSKTNARLKNENYARQVIAKVSARPEPKPINASWIAQNIPFVGSPQRGTHVAQILLEWGAFSEITEKGRKLYVYNEFWEPPTK